MDYVISGLPLAPFQALFGLDDAALLAHGAVRRTVDAADAFPCRVTLQDARPGDTVVLLSWPHLDVDTPYRQGGPIFVNESARQSASVRSAIPEQQRRRLLSVRAFDAHGWMTAADVVQGTQLAPLIDRLFADADVAWLHLHNARQGCYAARVDRGSLSTSDPSSLTEAVT